MDKLTTKPDPYWTKDELMSNKENSSKHSVKIILSDESRKELESLSIQI